MKNLIIPILFVLVLFFSCKKENQNKTILQPLDSIEIVTDTISLEFECLWFGKGPLHINYNDQYLIRNETEYDTLLRNKCSQYILPDIDFTKYMLAGYVTINGDGSTKVIKTIRKDNINHLIVYHMDFFVNADFYNDAGRFHSVNWILLPQMPVNWIFKVDTNTFIHK